MSTIPVEINASDAVASPRALHSKAVRAAQACFGRAVWAAAGILIPMLLLADPAVFGQQTSPDFNSLVQSATAARERGDLPVAIDLYRQAVSLHPDWSDGWLYLGLLQYTTDKYAQARDAFSHYIELTPNAGPETAVRGLCEFELGDYNAALQDVERGIALGAANDPDNQRILFYHEGLLLALAGDFEAALDAYSRLAHEQPSDPELFVAIGLAGLRKPMLPSNVPADQLQLYKQAGQAAYAFMSGEQQAADLAFQQLFATYPATPNMHYLYAYLLQAADPAAASIELNHELQANPSNDAALILAAWADVLQNKYRDGLGYARLAVAIHPEMPLAELEMGRCLVETGELKQGREYLEKVVQVQPENLEAHLALVAAYAKEDRPAEARRERLLCLKLSQLGGGVASQ